ncbi:hypothetical protein ACLKA6_017330 [Drosophila palustris]
MKVTALITQEDDTATPFEALIQRISSWTKLIRIVAYVLRYVQRIRPSKTSKLPSQTALTFDEIQAARIICLKQAQTCFKDDRQQILANKPLKNRSQLIKLAPMVLWSDETKINRFDSDGRSLYWTRDPTIQTQSNVQQTIKHGGGGGLWEYEN